MTEQPKPRGSISRRRRDGDDEPMMDINEVAAFLNTSVRHIRRLVSERRIPHYKIGGKLRFGRQETHELGPPQHHAFQRKGTDLLADPPGATARIVNESVAAPVRRLGPTAWAVLEVLRERSAVGEPGERIVEVSIREPLAVDLGLAKNTVHRALRPAPAMPVGSTPVKPARTPARSHAVTTCSRATSIIDDPRPAVASVTPTSSMMLDVLLLWHARF